jgi:hypothetical protein
MENPIKMDDLGVAAFLGHLQISGPIIGMVEIVEIH